jgi:hypothetical protein
MSGATLMAELIEDAGQISRAQDRRVAALEKQLWKLCSCGAHEFHTVSEHSRHCVYRKALLQVELEVRSS